MKKKFYIIGLFIAMFFCSGCTPEYNLEFNSGSIIEQLKIKDITSNYTNNDFSSRLAIPEKNQFYSTNFDNNVVTYKYKYNFQNISESNMINSCYNAYNFFEENNHYVLQTGSQFKCYPLQLNDFTFAEYSNLSIKIKFTGYEVVENNADIIDQNIYIWNINKDNYNNKPILIKFRKILSTKKKDNNSSIDVTTVLLIIIATIIIGIVVIIIALNLNKKRNEL